MYNFSKYKERQLLKPKLIQQIMHNNKLNHQRLRPTINQNRQTSNQSHEPSIVEEQAIVEEQPSVEEQAIVEKPTIVEEQPSVEESISVNDLLLNLAMFYKNNILKNK